jgi:formamidopyrimidine-DNA glycosylase
MPELPEVEGYKQYFERHALHQTIKRVRVLDERILGNTRKTTFVRDLTGRRFVAVKRHGKHLFADAGGTWLHLHFGMSGDLSYYEKDPPRFARVIFDFDNGKHLAFEDMRLFGFAELSPDPDTYVRQSGLGPDPLQIDLRTFRSLLGNRRGAIKAVLMAQHIVAGVGNLYADETLFRSGVDPRRPACEADLPVVFRNLKRVLADAIAGKWRGTIVEDREEGALCPKCGGTIARTVVGGRTTYYCPRHQR